MSVLIVGSTALDSIKTPNAENPRLLGGSASHAAVAASFFSPVKLIGVVGDDFPKKYLQLYRRHKIDLEGLQIRPGKTFHWSGEYEENMNHRRTLLTELGVFETFTPTLPQSYQRSPFVLLANIAPALQSHQAGAADIRQPRRTAAVVETVAERDQQPWRVPLDQARQPRQGRRSVVGRQQYTARGEGRALFQMQVGDDQQPLVGPIERARGVGDQCRADKGNRVIWPSRRKRVHSNWIPAYAGMSG